MGSRARPPLRLVTLGALVAVVGCTEPFSALPGAGFEPSTPFSVALAGADLSVVEGQRVQLSGAASRTDAGSARLVWTQKEGPPVSLTNPSAPAPTFIAPLSPATLVFSLQAEGSAVDVDSVTVQVGTSRRPPAGLVLAPPDATAAPSSRVSFDVDAAEPDGEVTFSARSPCAADVTVDGRTVSLTLPAALPCPVVVDAMTGGGRALAPAARVYWPEGTPLPAETRFTAGSVGVLPGASVVLTFAELAPEDRATAFGAYGGTALAEPIERDVIVFDAPRRPGRLVVGGEVRRGGASGGVRVALIDVSPGSGNTAPIARGGPDRIVLPGARFRFDVSGSFDADGDPLIITSTQVIGVPAAPDMAGSQVFIAPPTEGTLLFHVVADDAIVLSQPDPVRVIIDEGAENLRPVLTLPAELYVRPGQMFVIDASGAQDPDSGFIEEFFIAQADDDPVRLLGEPLRTPTASFVALDAGDVYHFLVSAFDEAGLGTTVEVAVVVEEAGPYVDPVRGDDTLGNGTPAQPFATILGALPTAERHAFEALLLAEGAHAAPPALLPPGLDLIGGHRFADDVYARAEDAVTTLPIPAPTTLSSSAIEAVRLDVAQDGALHLRDGAVLLDADVAAAPGARVAATVIVDADTHARLDGTHLDASNTEGAPALRVESGAVLASVDTTVIGGNGEDATALACDSGTVVVNGGALIGTQGGAERSNGLVASACVVVISDARVEGGAGDTAAGVSAQRSLLSVDAGSTVIGRTLAAGAGIGVSAADDASPLFIEGLVSASALVDDVPLPLDDARAIVLFGARAELGGARVRAQAPGARGIVAIGGALSATGADTRVLGVDAEALSLDGVVSAMLVGASITASGVDSVGVSVVGDAAELRLTDTAIEAGAVGVLAPDAIVVAVTSSIDVTGDVSVRSARGVSARAAELADATVTVQGAAAIGIDVVDGRLSRALVRVSSAGECAAVRTGATLDVDSSYLEGSAAGCLGVEAVDASVTLLHATVRAQTAVAWGGALTLHNSVLSGTPPLTTLSDRPFTDAIGLALDDVAPLAITAVGSLDLAGLEQQGCDLCSILDVDAFVDATGHLVDGANPLVDGADPAVSTALDIDGDARPSGVRPDLGCDER